MLDRVVKTRRRHRDGRTAADDGRPPHGDDHRTARRRHSHPTGTERRAAEQAGAAAVRRCRRAAGRRWRRVRGRQAPRRRRFPQRPSPASALISQSSRDLALRARAAQCVSWRRDAPLRRRRVVSATLALGAGLPPRRLRRRRRRQRASRPALSGAEATSGPARRRPASAGSSSTTPLTSARPKARGAADDIVLANDLVRVVARRARASVRSGADAAARSSISSLVGGARRPDQLDLPGGRAAPARRRSLREQPSDIEDGDRALRSRSSSAATWRRTRASRSSPATSCAPASPACACAAISTTASSDPNTLYLADGLFWGDNGALPFVPGAGLGFRAPDAEPARHRERLARVAVRRGALAGAARRLVRRRSLRSRRRRPASTTRR